MKCITCSSQGFNKSVLGPHRCTFCDGTEGGHPPKPEEIEEMAALIHWVTQSRIDPKTMETNSRFNGVDHRTVSVRWEPYKKDGQRQMKALGRWQEIDGEGDFFRWRNSIHPPQHLRRQP